MKLIGENEKNYAAVKQISTHTRHTHANKTKTIFVRGAAEGLKTKERTKKWFTFVKVKLNFAEVQ